MFLNLIRRPNREFTVHQARYKPNLALLPPTLTSSPTAACFPLVPSPNQSRIERRICCASATAPPPASVERPPPSPCSRLPIYVEMDRSQAVRSRSTERSSPLSTSRRAASRSHRAAAVVPSRRRRRYGGGDAGLG
jgi:hypothetical protein